MAPSSKAIRLSRTERVRRSARQGTSLSLPLAVYHRLDLLADEAADVDATRAEIIAMLICEARLDPEFLEEAILRYRKLTVGDVIPEDDDQPSEPRLEDAGNIVAIEPRRPGRRRRHGG